MPRPPIVIEIDPAWLDYWRSLADREEDEDGDDA